MKKLTKTEFWEKTKEKDTGDGFFLETQIGPRRYGQFYKKNTTKSERKKRYLNSYYGFYTQDLKERLYCPKCKEFPEEIMEVYTEPLVETRTWNEKIENWDLEESNIDDIEFEQICVKCGARLHLATAG